MNGGNLNCPLDCWSQGELPLKDTLQHLLKCVKLTSKLETEDISRGNVEYEPLFSDVYKQKKATVLFERLLKAREDIKNADPPGVNLRVDQYKVNCIAIQYKGVCIVLNC
jgi:hypothetical protein